MTDGIVSVLRVDPVGLGTWQAEMHSAYDD
ncbi:MAG: hypothetical protein ACJARS_005055 [bacterium]|jgi:hypothetical protein